MGGAVGTFAGWVAPAVGSFFGTSFTLGQFALASGETVTLSITGGQAVAGLVGLNILFASTNRPGNNKKQNAQVRDAVRELGYNPNDPRIKDIINEVVMYIRKNRLNLGYKGLLELLMDFLP